MYLELENLCKRYGDIEAVNNVTLNVENGEFLTLLGPSGSGKTTLLRMIAGFTIPSNGHIRIDGQPIEDKPPHKRDIGMVFQNYSLFPHMTIYENIAFGLRMRKVPERERIERVGKALDTVQLSGYEDRKPDQISGGEQQRVALARAIVIEPLVLLLDEPLGALDRKLREAMQFELRRIHDQLDITTVYVTHDQDEALSLSDRIAILNQGSLLQLGSPIEVYEQPASTFVADFLGKANLFWLSVTSSDSHKINATFYESFTLSLPPNENIEKGDRIRVLVRPERTTCHVEQDTSMSNAIHCKVEQVSYLGAEAYLFLRGPGDLEFLSFLSSQELAEDKVPTEGQEVSVSWPDEAAIIVEHE